MTRSEAVNLELTRLTTGICDKGFFGGRQFSFGIFGREDVLRKKMALWRDEDIEKVNKGITLVFEMALDLWK